MEGGFPAERDRGCDQGGLAAPLADDSEAAADERPDGLRPDSDVASGAGRLGDAHPRHPARRPHRPHLQPEGAGAALTTHPRETERATAGEVDRQPVLTLNEQASARWSARRSRRPRCSARASTSAQLWTSASLPPACALRPPTAGCTTHGRPTRPPPPSSGASDRVAGRRSRRHAPGRPPRTMGRRWRLGLGEVRIAAAPPARPHRGAAALTLES
mmetsp:Transcript_33547/g.111971  ORF Transcript_33547/g.111971 Transcript_33547/m.111971 type:complete len:216 (-) Transcript_33547:219-866(-)